MSVQKLKQQMATAEGQQVWCLATKLVITVDTWTHLTQNPTTLTKPTEAQPASTQYQALLHQKSKHNTT